MSKNPRLIRAVRSIERRMFLKALGVGLAVPAALRLARVATAAAGTPPKRFFLFLHASRRGARALRSPAGRRRPDQLRARPDQRQHPGAAAAVQAVRQRLPGFSVSGRGGDPHRHRQLPVGLDVERHHDAAHDGRAGDRQGARGQAADPRAPVRTCPTAWTSNGMLFWDGTPIDPAEEPGQGRRRAVRRRSARRRRSTSTSSCARTCWR